ncbi:DUF742 domain-containing protein [Streptomyces sp. NPDC059371]|uniref:DUF742 domain-containing protein n=1 Tax=Streptomyces sp. NPDC059371 TaxID=3346812 RepID=UPI0036C0BD43
MGAASVKVEFVTSSPDRDKYGPNRHPEAGPNGFRSHAMGRSARPSALVRPYAMTGGRTRPRHHLAIEALVSATADPRHALGLSPEAYRICVLCQEIKSVAEVSALLSIPLGVTRILVADLAESGLVSIQQSHGDDAEGGRPQVTLLERVLSGLRRM